MELHYPRDDVLKFLLTRDKTSSSMQTAPLKQGIMPPKRFDTITNIAEKWKQLKQFWDYYSIITNLTAQKKKYRVVDCGASINFFTKFHTTGSYVTPSNRTLKMRNGTEMKPFGTTHLKVSNAKTGKKYSSNLSFFLII